MTRFFAEELSVDIDDDTYREHGTLKAKRLRCYLNKVDPLTSVKTLQALWEYREGIRKHREREEWVPNAEGRFFSLLNRMQGKPGAVPIGDLRWPARQMSGVMRTKGCPDSAGAKHLSLGRKTPTRIGESIRDASDSARRLRRHQLWLSRSRRNSMKRCVFAGSRRVSVMA